MTSALITGISGMVLTADERAFLADCKPAGLILFARNCVSSEQIRALVDDVRAAAGGGALLVLIDQEGGRVQRLRPPVSRLLPPAAAYARLYARDRDAGRTAAFAHARFVAGSLTRLGINTNCAPVLDVPVAGAHDIIGDRAYAQDPATVTQLGRAVAEGLLAGGVLPVIKHMPGHGRAFADSHKELPTVHADLDTLDSWDFAPFKALSDMPIGMTAHIVFTAIDKKRPATQSKKAIRLIRDHLGFGGLLLSDDLCMNALAGTLTERAERSLRAGCDLVIHWTGDMAEMRQVAEGVHRLKGGAAKRAEVALARIVHTPEPLDVREARDRFDALLGGRLDASKGPDVGEAQAPASSRANAR